MSEFAIGVITSILGGILLSWLVFLTKSFNTLRQTIIETVLPTAIEIASLEEFFRYAAAAFKECEDKKDSLLVYWCTPFGYTEPLLRHMLGDRHELIERLLYGDVQELNRYIRQQVGTSFGYPDKMIFGRTGNAEIDRATGRFVDDLYFASLDHSGRFAATSELGIHENLNEMTVLLIGEAESATTEDVRLKHWRRGFLLFHAVDFHTASGYLYKNPQLIANLMKAWERKRADIDSTTYWNMKVTASQISTVRDTIRRFYNYQPR